MAILGAGCSKAYGYPLAVDMLSQLTEFSQLIGTSAPKLALHTEKTIRLFQKYGAETLDDLAALVHQKDLAARFATSEYQNVEVAKTVVSAMFLQKEKDAMAHGRRGYHEFIKEIFPSSTKGWEALQNSNWRILNFNYDRLFELAFRKRYYIDMNDTFYGPTRMNSGLRQMLPGTVEIEPNRFALLKLHGSVGFSVGNRHGEVEHHVMIPDPDSPEPIDDKRFIYNDVDAAKAERVRPSLIVFPHEKPE